MECGRRGSRPAWVPRRVVGYARQDRRTQPRDPINTRFVAQLFEAAGVDRLVAIDAHNAAALDNAFRVGADHLSALPMCVDYFFRRPVASDFLVVSPDVGGIKRIQIFRELLQERLRPEIDLVSVEKRRNNGKASGGTVVGSVEGRPVIVLDDLCATGGTLLRAAAKLAGSGGDCGARGGHPCTAHSWIDGLGSRPGISMPW